VLFEPVHVAEIGVSFHLPQQFHGLGVETRLAWIGVRNDRVDLHCYYKPIRSDQPRSPYSLACYSHRLPIQIVYRNQYAPLLKALGRVLPDHVAPVGDALADRVKQSAHAQILRDLILDVQLIRTMAADGPHPSDWLSAPPRKTLFPTKTRKAGARRNTGLPNQAAQPIMAGDPQPSPYYRSLARTA
jgi:hypothetical protein